MPRERPPEDDIRGYTDRLEVGPIDPDARRARKRSRLIRRALLVTALVVGVGGGALFVELRSRTTPVSVEDSLERFRAAAGEAAGERVRGLPVPGVYVLATEGGDAVTVLGGSRHDYPEQTTLTVTPESCGMRLRWDALGERWEEWVLCPDGDRLDIRSVTSFHRFFARSDRREFFCGEDGTYLPGVTTAGATWSATCSSADGTTSLTEGELVGVVFLSVGGERVRTLHVRMTTRFTGPTEGTREAELWVVAATGLPVVIVSRDDLDTPSPLGRTHYTEAYRGELTSLDPRI